MLTSFTKIVKVMIFLVTCLGALNGNAQVALFQNTIDKIDSYKNFSVQYISKQKETFGDTLIQDQKFIFLKKPEDKEIGYFFRHEYRYGDMTVPAIDLYDGKTQMSVNSIDSTYQASNQQVNTLNQSLLGQLIWIKTFLKKNPSKLIRAPDTIVNSLNSYHFIINVRDTIINKDHVYVRRHLFIEQISGLPIRILNRARTADFSKKVANYYTEENYFNYQFDQDTINVAYFVKPAEFHPFKEKPKKQMPLLAPGTIAPEWTLYDTDDKKTSLSQFKGKMVLLDFFFVGCTNCLQSLASLDNLKKKYKSKDFVILSISTRDSKKLVKEFKKKEQIKNQMYPSGDEVANLYRAYRAPTFYLVDQAGKISSVVEGYSDDFEKKMSDLMDALIKKH